MSLTSVIEEYIEAIYTLSQTGKVVIGARLAEIIGVSPATVTETVRRMERDGFVSTDAKRGISLTEAGLEKAEALVRRHSLSERWLSDVLGIEWHKVHEEACRLEHALSDEVEQRLADSLGNPTTCPHGNPIPGRLRPAELSPSKPLSSVTVGETITVDHIGEDAEKDPVLLQYLQRHAITPGAGVTVTEIVPFDGTVVVVSASGSVAVSSRVADLIWVRSQT